MNTDGTGKELLPYQSQGTLSHEMHLGHRWFLEFRLSPTYEVNGFRSALYAVREDGDPEHVVLLIDDPNSYMVDCRWGKSDELVSVVYQGASIADGRAHLDAAGIEFDTDGVPFLSTPFIQIAQGEPNQYGWCDIINHDWSPSGTQVVYQLKGNPGAASVWIADMVSGTTVLFADDSWEPSWSPDGARIAYKPYNEGIRIAYPDGTGQVQITKNGLDVSPGWSPDSKHILFNRYIIRNVKGVYEQSADILRVPATGGTAFNLTKDIDGLDLMMYCR
jgi:hypothetical protein